MSAPGKAEHILSYMEERFQQGEFYFKSHRMEDKLPYSAKEIGSTLGVIDQGYKDVLEEQHRDGYPESLQWGNSNGSTWYAKPLFEDAELYEEICERCDIQYTSREYADTGTAEDGEHTGR